ncbi:hypothetical protein ACJH6H_29340 [Mycobacterium sp. SMC-21]|uniref:hypothetical protein n=1 Tax=Mycobacterium sp. SMC-21 TaxID=3381632 RepID=UPI003875BEFE
MGITATEFDTAATPSLQFVIDHLTECRNGVGERKETHCGKTPVAVATDPRLPADDNMFPICSDCLIEDGGENDNFLPLADYVSLLAQHTTNNESE